MIDISRQFNVEYILGVMFFFFRSWILDHITEIVHLVTQIQMTKEIEQTLNDTDGGNKDAFQVQTNPFYFSESSHTDLLLDR